MQNFSKFLFLCLFFFLSLFQAYGQDWNFRNRGSSYYPRDAAWDSMWTVFDTSIIARDFEELKVLGCNFVRIVIRPNVCGFPGRGSRFDQFESKFETLLELVEKHDLIVHIVVFDDMRPSDFSAFDLCKAWIDSLVVPRVQDKRIFRWELFSELNLVCRNNDEPDTTTVINWYKEIFPYLKEKKGKDQQATVSVAIYDRAYVECKFFKYILDLPFESLPDIYSIASYKYSFLLPAIYDTIQFIIQKNDPDKSKKIAVTELGWDTYTNTELFQRDQFRNMFWYLKQKSVDDICIWTLWDFSKQNLPELLREKKQHYFGLRRVDGSYKPAYDVVYAVFHDQKLSYEIANPSFELTHDILTNINISPSSLPDSWQYWRQSEKNYGMVTVSNQEAFMGLNSIKIFKTDTVGVFYEQGIPVIPGKNYKLRAFVKTKGTCGSNFISISWHKSSIYDNLTWIRDSASDTLKEAKKWKMLEVVAAAPDFSILARPFCKSLNNSDTVYFDYFSFLPMHSVAFNVNFNNNPQIESVELTLYKYIEPFHEPKFFKFKNSGIVRALLDQGWYQAKFYIRFFKKAPYTLTKELFFINQDTTIFYDTAIDPVEFSNQISYSLMPAYPNPFNDATHIQFSLPKTSLVKLIVYDVLGREVIELLSERLESGLHQAKWDGCDAFGNQVASDIYFVTLKADNYHAVNKLLLVK